MKKWIICTATLLMAGINIQGREYTFVRGTQEIALRGSYTYNQPDGDVLDMMFAYGFFFRDRLEAGPVLEWHDSDSISLWSAGVFTEYTYDLGYPFYPYLGGRLLYLNTDRAGNDGAALGFSLGFKIILINDVALDFGLHQTLATDDIYQTDDGANHTLTYVGLGLRFFY